MFELPENYVFITNEADVNYAYKIVKQGLDYYCEGYALAHGIKIAEWRYIALDVFEAREQATKDYLLRELRPMAVQALKHLATSYENWLNYVRIENSKTIKEAVEAAN